MISCDLCGNQDGAALWVLHVNGVATDNRVANLRVECAKGRHLCCEDCAAGDCRCEFNERGRCTGRHPQPDNPPGGFSPIGLALLGDMDDDEEGTR